MGGHHAHRPPPESAQLRRIAALIIAPIALATVVALAVLWPARMPAPDATGTAGEVSGKITAIQPTTCTEKLSDEVNGCGDADVRLGDDAGADAGAGIVVPLPNGPGAPKVNVGDHVVVLKSVTPDGQTYAIIDHQRSTGLWMLAAAFALAVVAFGRLRGVMALVGLTVTFGILLFFVIPAIVAGESPLLVAIVGSAAIMLTVLYLTHGFTMSTTVAILGTLAALSLTGVISAITVVGLQLTGITDDISTSVGMNHQVDMRGVLLASIVIGSLGVLDDVTVTQAATVAEVAEANPAYGFRQLYGAGSRVGRSHIASVINTIILAYAGSSLPLLILILANRSSLGAIVTDQVIAQEIARSAVATMGLIAAVPLTTAMAAFVSSRTRSSQDQRPGRRKR